MTAAAPQPLLRPSDNHPTFPQPTNRHVSVWRYLNVPHAFDLLKNRRLWMSRADHLGDPCEGTRPSGDAQIYRAAEQVIMSQTTDPSLANSYLAEVRGSWRHMDSTLRERMFISCWTLGDHDDMAMWERYCRPKEAGIAIQTTYAKLDASLPIQVYNGRWVMMGLVTYGDYDSLDFRSDPANAYSAYMLKKVQYRSEHEIRIVCDMFRSSSGGIVVPVNVEMLVEKMVFSPYAKTPLVNGVERAIRDLGYTFPISRSSTFNVSKPY